MRDHQSEFEKLDTEVVLITFVGGRRAESWLADSRLTFPLLLDESLHVFRAYGLGRARLADWTPRVIWQYIRLIFRGFLPRRVSGDPYQLGGDFLIDSSGVVRSAHPGRDAADRPSVECLLESARSL